MNNNISKLSSLLHDFAKKRDWEQFHSPKNLSMALTAEAGELLEHFQWLTEEESQSLDGDKKQEVAYEMADILIYLLRIGQRLDIDVVEAAFEKMQINEQRFPIDKS